MTAPVTASPRSRTSTPTAEARAWVMALPEGSFFWQYEVPAPSRIASVMLCRLAQGDDPPIRRLGKGFYWRVSRWSSGNPRPHDPNLAALIYAGPGSGYADCSATNWMDWSTQCPARERIATMRQTAPLDRFTAYVHRPANQRRERLSWAEVSLIEAVQHFGLSEEEWDDAVELVADGTSIAKLYYPSTIRADAVCWAAETEISPSARWPCEPRAVFQERIADLCARIPAEQTGRWGRAEAA